VNSRIVVVGLIASVGIFALSTSTAWAADGPGGSGSGSLGPVGIGSNAGVPGRSESPAPISYTPPPPNAPPSNNSGYTWTDVGADLNSHCVDGQAVQGPPVIGANGPGTGQSLGPPGLAGYPDLDLLIGPNGQTIDEVDVCSQAAAALPPPPPPPPPTPAEVWADSPLPTPSFGFDPATLGLTQLQTWFWLGGVGGPVTVTVEIRGYTVTTIAHPVAYYWWFGDSASAVGQSAGSQSDPSVTHTYVTKGSYQVEVIVAWAGQYTFAGNGVPAETVDLGTVDGPAAAAGYGVQEVRGVGTSG
jgi:PKD domain